MPDYTPLYCGQVVDEAGKKIPNQGACPTRLMWGCSDDDKVNNPTKCKVCYNYNGDGDLVCSGNGGNPPSNCAESAAPGNPTPTPPNSWNGKQAYCIPSKSIESGDHPKITASYRKINILNKCNDPIRIISTLSNDINFKKAFPEDFVPKNDPRYIKEGQIYKTASGSIPGNMATPTSFYEKLGLFNGSLGCDESLDSSWPSGRPCRPGVNYEAVWDVPTGQNEFTDKMDHYQGKIEFTFGAGGTRDFMDLSGMIDGGCASHTAPYENDIGMHDTNPFCNTYVCRSANGRDIKCDSIPSDTTKWYPNRNNLSQVNHRMKDIEDIYTDPIWSSNNIQKDDKNNYVNSQICLNTGNPNNPLWPSRYMCKHKTGDDKNIFQCPNNTPPPDSSDLLLLGDCTRMEDTGKDLFVCGWPYKYYFEDVDDNDNTGVYTIDKINDELSWFKCDDFNDVSNKGHYLKYGDPTKKCPNCEIPNPCKGISSRLNDKIMGAVRNDFYSCSLTQHSGIDDYGNRTVYDPKTGGKYTDMIPFSLSAPPSNNCPKDKPMPRNCIFNPLDFTDNESGCAGYTFAYDDALAGYECFVDKNIPTPEYTITFCPDSSPPSQDPHPIIDSCSTPSPYSNGSWISDSSKPDYWSYVCNTDFHMNNQLPTPTASCITEGNNKILHYSLPSPDNTTCIHDCEPSPLKEPSGHWDKLPNGWKFTCNLKYAPIDRPTPTARCDPIQGLIPSQSQLSSNIIGYCTPSPDSHSCSTPPSFPNGHWDRNHETDNVYYASCNPGYNLNASSPEIVCDDLLCFAISKNHVKPDVTVLKNCASSALITVDI